MTRTFITTTIFDKRWIELGLSDDDLRELENYLMETLDLAILLKEQAVLLNFVGPPRHR